MAFKNIITTNKLSKTFSSGGVQTHVLRNLDLEIREGDFTVIMGVSGSGKSTLLYALSGIDKPSLGSIKFNGEELSTKNNDQLAVFRRSNCGFVFQQISLNENMTLMENVLISGFLLRSNRREVERRAKGLFALVNLDREQWNRFPTQLSGGEAQRGAIVRALINKPTMLFADEPTGSLNSASSEAVLNLLTKSNASGQSIIMVTHDITTALRGNRVLYLKDGVISMEFSLGDYRVDLTEEEEAERRLKLHQQLALMGW